MVGIAGRIRSGKTTVAKFMERQYGAHVFRNSAVLGGILDKLHIEPTRRNYAGLGEALFSSFGYAVLAEAIAFEIVRSVPEGEIAVIDGIRFPEEVDVYSSKGEFRLIMLSANEEARFERAIKAREFDKQDDHCLSFEEFGSLQNATSERRLHELSARAHSKIANNGSIRDLHQSVIDICLMWNIASI